MKPCHYTNAVQKFIKTVQNEVICNLDGELNILDDIPELLEYALRKVYIGGFDHGYLERDKEKLNKESDKESDEESGVSLKNVLELVKLMGDTIENLDSNLFKFEARLTHIEETIDNVKETFSYRTEQLSATIRNYISAPNALDF